MGLKFGGINKFQCAKGGCHTQKYFRTYSRYIMFLLLAKASEQRSPVTSPKLSCVQFTLKLHFIEILVA